MTEKIKNKFFMKMALGLAAAARGHTSPNPLVGAVVVKGGTVIGKGYHKKAGTPHAEVHALDEAGAAAEGSTLYVSLEPCCHQGRTPACVDRIIKERIGRVVVAMEDPNPLVSGKGIEKLRKAGIMVHTGVMEKEAKRMNAFFIKYITTGTPFITIKSAVTMDGKICTKSGDSYWISGDLSREFVHKQRYYHDAVMVGINTVIKDDPLLTCRLDEDKPVYPYRIVVDSFLRIPLSAKLLADEEQEKIIIATTVGADRRKMHELEAMGVTVVSAGVEKVDWNIFFKRLGKKEITSILVEGGGNINASLIDSGFTDRIYLFIAPKIIGGREALTFVEGEGIELMSEAKGFKLAGINKFAEDVMLEYTPAEV